MVDEECIQSRRTAHPLEEQVAFKILLRPLPDLRVADERLEERVGVSVVRQLFYVKRKFLPHRQTAVRTACTWKPGKNSGHLHGLRSDATLGSWQVNFTPVLFS
jgi:hypothetical protein